VAPSAIPFDAGWHTPAALDDAGLARVRDAFVAAARRAVAIGFDAVELHMAHGYLMHEFLSPLCNRRTDRYGGALINRLRFPLEVAQAVRAVVPDRMALGARITGTDWVEGGWTVEDAIILANELKAIGAAFVCVSSGGIYEGIRVPIEPGYQVPLAARVRQGSGIATRAVGLIVDAEQAERIVANDQADLVAIARALLDNPRWVWHAADRLGARIAYPPQYARVAAALWPGARLARPNDFAVVQQAAK